MIQYSGHHDWLLPIDSHFPRSLWLVEVKDTGPLKEADFTEFTRSWGSNGDQDIQWEFQDPKMELR